MTHTSNRTVSVERDSRVAYYHVSGSVLAGTVVLMLLGAYTSAIGAGLACPDWPACYGTVVPFLHPEVMAATPYTTLQVFAEWAHRGVASVVGLGIVGTALLAHTRQKRPLVRRTAALAVGLLPVQVLLGGLTVTRDLQPAVVTGHLGVALLILLSLATATVADYTTTA